MRKYLLIANMLAVVTFLLGALILPVECRAQSEAEMGKISVITEPSEAKVYIDATYVGESPTLQIEVPEGTHHIEARKEGYGSAYKDVYVPQGELVTVRLKLEKVEIIKRVKPVEERKIGLGAKYGMVGMGPALWEVVNQIVQDLGLNADGPRGVCKYSGAYISYKLSPRFAFALSYGEIAPEEDPPIRFVPPPGGNGGTGSYTFRLNAPTLDLILTLPTRRAVLFLGAGPAHYEVEVHFTYEGVKSLYRGSKFGYHAFVGVDLLLGETISLGLEARYLGGDEINLTDVNTGATWDYPFIVRGGEGTVRICFYF